MLNEQTRAQIRKVLSLYKENFAGWIPHELYKWRAVAWFRQRWDLNAADLPGMLKDALSKTDNLFKERFWNPRDAIITMAKAEPETVRETLARLLDESQPLSGRIRAFKDSAAQLWKRCQEAGSVGEKSCHDDKAACRFLFFAYPEKYFLYQFRKYTDFVAQTGLPVGKWTPECGYALPYMDLASHVAEVVREDSDLLSMLNERLDKDCYPDEACHLLADDVFWFVKWTKLPETLKKPENKEQEDSRMDIGKNMILYGPPGTGKTYHTVNYAVAIIEGKALAEIREENHSAVLSRFNHYREEGRIAFVTFHQSYGYEDFIEGIRPVFPDEAEAENALSYDLIDGAFKKFCNCAEYDAAGDDYGFSADSTVWKVSLGGAGENPVKADCMKNGYIRVGWDEYGKDLSEETAFKRGGKAILNAFLNGMQIGDIVLSCRSSKSVDAIGVIMGECEWYAGFPHMKRFRKVKWLAKGQNLNIGQFGLQKALMPATVYKLKTTAAHVKSVLHELDGAPLPANVPAPPCVFIIDEINRGNISKIFGELITLIEPEKRKGKPEYLPVKLAYSQSEFGVPDNVWILGTMNTADRSIALLDTALRRRFQFREMMPDVYVLDGITVEGVAVSGLLDTLNRRITALYDREHTLGHAWFLPLRDEPTLARLGAIFRDSVIPLLQEYFYDDYEKIRLVLGDEKRKHTGGPQFFQSEEPNPLKLFGTDADFPLNVFYRLNPDTLTDIEAYRNL